MVGNPKGRTANGRGRESRLSFYSVFDVILDVVSRASLGISKVFQIVPAVVYSWRLLMVQLVREEPSDVLLLLVTENPPLFSASWVSMENDLQCMKPIYCTGSPTHILRGGGGGGGAPVTVHHLLVLLVQAVQK